jgi:hypothetical protein
MHIHTISPKINRLHPLRDLERLGGLTCIHETVPKVDEITVCGSSLIHHRTQASTSMKARPTHTISYLPNYTVKQTQKGYSINH